MDNKDYTQSALCKFTEVEAVSLMPGIARKSIYLFLDVMGIEIEQNVPVSVSFTAFMDEFLDNGDWIIKIIPPVYLDFLLEIWNKMEKYRNQPEAMVPIYMDEQDWQIVFYLATFGLVGYHRGQNTSSDPSVIFVVREVMDAFYFQLKSRKTQILMEKYSQWEALIEGYLKILGVIPISQIKCMLEEVTKNDILLEDVLEFLRCRTTFWSVGRLYYDEESGEGYFSSNIVEEPVSLFQSIQKCDILKYKHYTQQELFGMHESLGGYRKWRGVQALGSYLMDELEMDYYRATVLLSKSIYDMQNGHDFAHLLDLFDQVTHDQIEKPEKLTDILEVFYQNIPVFGLKGHSHAEYDARLQQLERQKKRISFKFIK